MLGRKRLVSSSAAPTKRRLPTLFFSDHSKNCRKYVHPIRNFFTCHLKCARRNIVESSGSESWTPPRLGYRSCIEETPTRPPLSPSQIRDLKAAFKMLDKNSDGKVNETEIKSMLEKLGIVFTDSMVNKLIEQASKRGDGLLSEEEFLTWMSRQSVQDDIMADLMAAFRVFDKDGNGYINKDELRMAMEVIGETMSDEQLDAMLRATDADNDGRINYEEFVRILL